MPAVATDLTAFVAGRLLARNEVSRTFFERESQRFAVVCEQMSRRFLRGGRLLAFGRGALATDAQHVAVEFVHPVIVGKRALPALDVSAAFADWLPAIATDADIALGFSPPEGDPAVTQALGEVRRLGVMTLALPGTGADVSVTSPTNDRFIAQEIVEILYHTLWETVHVYFEHSEQGHDDLGDSAFLYPFLDQSATPDTSRLHDHVATSIRTKAAEDERLREETASDQAGIIADAVRAIGQRVRAGATLLMFGNGGSATDANDWTIDCVSAPAGQRIRALSLATEPATITALANDIGREATFLRQLIAHGRPGDVAIAISTSGGSSNVIAALQEGRKRQMLTVALLGYDGGEIVRSGLADLPIVVRCDYIPRIQEIQASIYHVITEALRTWR